MGDSAGAAVFFNAHSSKSTSCYDCPITYNGVYADSHSALDVETGKELDKSEMKMQECYRPPVLYIGNLNL